MPFIISSMLLQEAELLITIQISNSSHCYFSLSMLSTDSQNRHMQCLKWSLHIIWVWVLFYSKAGISETPQYRGKMWGHHICIPHSCNMLKHTLRCYQLETSPDTKYNANALSENQTFQFSQISNCTKSSYVPPVLADSLLWKPHQY